MALRTRPFKFTLWKVANAQKRTCRASIQRSVAIEENDSRQKAPLTFEDLFRRITPKSDSPLLEDSKEGDWFSLQKDVAPRALAILLEEKSSRLSKLCLGEEGSLSKGKDNTYAHGTCCSNTCAALPENHVGSSFDVPSSGFDKLFGPYMQTADDILVGSENNQVETSQKVVDPRLAAEFFTYSRLLSQRWESMEGILSQIGAKIESRSDLGVAANPANESSYTEAQICLQDETKMTAEMVQLIDFCIDNCLSLEEPPSWTSEFVNKLPVPQDFGKKSLASTEDFSGVLYFDDNTKEIKPKGDDKSGRPTLDQLRNMHDYLVETLPNIFIHRHEYRIYKRDVVFENNFVDPPKTTVGLTAYALQVAKLRIGAHFQYANVRLHLLKSTTHEDEGCIRISWRITGIPQVRAFMFWKFLPWNYKNSKSSESEWREGISTFYLDGDGRIAKHQMDRVIQDKGPVAKEEIVKIPGLAV